MCVILLFIFQTHNMSTESSVLEKEGIIKNTIIKKGLYRLYKGIIKN